MRFNKQEMLTLATQPSQKFDKEGILFLRERQDGLFRRSEREPSSLMHLKCFPVVPPNSQAKRSKSLRDLSCYGVAGKVCLERWCRLRGNLLFYFKSKDQWSEPVGVIVLTHCSIKMDQPPVDGPYGFFLVFEGGLSQHLAAHSEPERDAWLELIQRSSYSSVRSQFLALQQQMELRRGHDPTLDVHMWRLRRGRCVDPSEIPLCEIALSCDNLLCDGNGRPPNPLLVLHVFIPGDGVWLKYANTELIERSSNPTFLQTVCLRSSDGLNEDTRLRITAYDVREAFSQISTIIGSVTIRLSTIMRSNEPRLRISLLSAFGVTIGFLSICVFKHEPETSNNPSSESTPCRSLPQHNLSVKLSHRRSLDVHMWRLRRGRCVDPSEIPLCEIALSCDNLLCDGNGRPPNPLLVLHVFIPGDGVWLKYANTELIERSSNPTFLQTVCLRSSDGLNEDTRLRITAYDVREAFSQISTIIGSVTIRLSTIMRSNEPRLRISLLSAFGVTIGFLSICVFKHEPETSNNPSSESTPCRSLPQHNLSVKLSHRRTQSLPPRLGSRLRLPNQGHLKYLFANATVTTYRFHSGLGGDISVHEVMAESRLCFTFPQQLLGIWIQEEKELLQEVAGMGELVEPWHSKQVELLDRHLQLLHLYSQAKENLAAHKGSYFKQSCKKTDRSLEFAPINLHLQRMWAHSESLKKCEFHDVITVGAFTAHSHKSRNGGLIKLLQQLKDSPNDNAVSSSANKIATAHDAIQAIKQLRREVVDAMRSLMSLAKLKQTNGMLPICEDMMTKTRILLSLWDPELVEEALAFIEEHKVSHLTGGDNGLDDPMVTMSPFRRITQQLNLDLKSPDCDLMELQTPDSPRYLASFLSLAKANDSSSTTREDEAQFIIFPEAEVEENHPKTDENSNLSSSPIHIRSNNTSLPDHNTSFNDHNTNTPVNSRRENHGADVRKFLDTQEMCSSPSANYYRPSEEPEPWDLTQLNIEASVMCLVSKVKFLCGRCGSPAPRVKSKAIGRSRSFREESALNPGSPAVGVKSKAIGRSRSFREESALNPGLLCRKPDPIFLHILTTIGPLVCFEGLLSYYGPEVDMLLCRKPDPIFLHILTTIGPLVCFEGLLSYYGPEVDMWGDMIVAIEDLATVNFTITRVKKGCDFTPKVVGSRSALGVLLPVPDVILSLLPVSQSFTHVFRVTPVFFNIGINEKATLAETLGTTKPQIQSNVDNFDRLNEYYHRFKRLNVPLSNRLPSLPRLMEKMKVATHTNKSKNVEILHLAAKITRLMRGLKLTSCKSAKDRTGMSTTLEQVDILSSEYDLAVELTEIEQSLLGDLRRTKPVESDRDLSLCRRVTEIQKALDCMRSEGCRRENTFKNIGVRKYAFNSIQIMALPTLYRAPPGTYGSAQT
ncbi:LOW QUALITY PROTEIN: type I inositol 3,4-bisphosphate 4-phosphatase-like [Diaphorina citri]|uniref:phosphatidylinositol-3,4-bisphosphate 4-phosphatase n=1 Tax=Diaphorina citri TaxID=121845 RepID=A0A1S4EIX2_DIACI|nr:LOW QUALITY PROTEIN: type I inositol 3,4-bisphosphate 4-phosphatase-like [Diaphorina citri]